MPKFLRGRWLPLTVAIIALTIIFILLGVWQLQRLGQRRAANANLIARMEQAPLTLDGSALDVDSADLRRATVTGVFDAANEVVLRNRAYNESAGVHILTPLRITGSDVALLVDRGWIPYDAASQLANFPPPAGEVTVAGILRRGQTRTSSLAPMDVLPPGGSRLDAWHRVDIAAIQGQTPYTLLPVYMEQERLDANDFSLPRPDPDIALDEGPHLGYAIQWFAFAFIACFGYIFFYHVRSGANSDVTPEDEEAF
jgi:surfeit locus 1 family protein